MKKYCVITLIVLLTTSLTAQEKTFFISASGGFTQPYATLEFTSYYKQGMGFAGEFGYQWSKKMSFLGAVSYNTFEFDEEGSKRDRGLSGLAIDVVGDPAQITTFTGHIRMKTKETIDEPIVYFDAGVGFQHVFYPEFSASADGITETFPEDKLNQFLLSFGAGMDFPLSGNMSFIVDARVMAALVGGAGAQYFRAGGGLKYSFGK